MPGPVYVHVDAVPQPPLFAAQGLIAMQFRVLSPVNSQEKPFPQPPLLAAHRFADWFSESDKRTMANSE
jgi:hypothetical protein